MISALLGLLNPVEPAPWVSSWWPPPPSMGSVGASSDRKPVFAHFYLSCVKVWGMTRVLFPFSWCRTPSPTTSPARSPCFCHLHDGWLLRYCPIKNCLSSIIWWAVICSRVHMQVKIYKKEAWAVSFFLGQLSFKVLSSQYSVLLITWCPGSSVWCWSR